jgi:hypothetical protein
MKLNVGSYDRAIRIILGLLIIALGIIFKSFLGLFGLIPLVTGVFRLCPLYMPFKINTNKKS